LGDLPAAHPLKSVRRGVGERDVIVAFNGVMFQPGARLYADEDGLIVAPAAPWGLFRPFPQARTGPGPSRNPPGFAPFRAAAREVRLLAAARVRNFQRIDF
jgi:hypothetical protein